MQLDLSRLVESVKEPLEHTVKIQNGGTSYVRNSKFKKKKNC